MRGKVASEALLRDQRMETFPHACERGETLRGWEKEPVSLRHCHAGERRTVHMHAIGRIANEFCELKRRHATAVEDPLVGVFRMMFRRGLRRDVRYDEDCLHHGQKGAVEGVGQKLEDLRLVRRAEAGLASPLAQSGGHHGLPILLATGGNRDVGAAALRTELVEEHEPSVSREHHDPDRRKESSTGDRTSHVLTRPILHDDVEEDLHEWRTPEWPLEDINDRVIRIEDTLEGRVGTIVLDERPNANHVGTLESYTEHWPKTMDLNGHDSSSASAS